MAPFAQKRMLAHLNPDHVDKPPAKTGRPSEYKPEYCDLVLEKMAEGLSLTGFAGYIKVAKETVYGWMAEQRAFSDAVARARSARVHKLELKLLGARKGAEATTSIFALRNADPSEWRDMRQVTHEHNVTLQTMSDEQLLAIAQGQSHDARHMIDVSPGKKK